MLRFLTLILTVIPTLSSAEDAAPPEEVARPVVTEIVSPGPVQKRSFTGIIEAEVTTNLAFLTLGRVATLPVSAGDKVTQGQVLATLDQVTLNEDLASAEAALQGAIARAQFAQQSYDRVKQLVVRGVATAAQLESAQAGLDTAKASVTASEADLSRANDAARYSELKAPIDGIVTATLVETGTVVSVGTPILTLAGILGREAVLDVPAEFLALLNPGDVFTITGRGSDPVQGVLRLVEPVADKGTRSRRLRLTLQDPPESYRIGSLISAQLAANAADVITVPASAIVDGKVWVVGDQRNVAQVPVTVGAASGSRIVITGGIQSGQEIVVRGVHSLTEGQSVGEGIN
ncbi:MAG: efflux RND transporter periplasmic adaptor subunit [Fuscovulum sp.]|nr:MAG: efflux RND transporter periplasmic adaptor subunit [Fuscovulum sp.]